MAKKDPKAFVTNETLDDAVDTLLKGMDNMLIEQKKYFASKDDLKKVENKLTKVERNLTNEIRWVKDDVNGLKADLSRVPSRTEFDRLKASVGKDLTS